MRKYTVLLMLLLLILLALPVFAAPAGTLSVGQTVTTNVAPYGAEEYTFTPAESGDYAVCMEETDANFQQWVCLDGSTQVPERYYMVAGWEGKVFSLTAGKTYTIRVTHDTGYGGTFARKMRLEKVTATTTLSLRGSMEVYYPGDVVWVDPVLTHPGAVSGNFRWSSSNPAVARIEDTGSVHAAVMPVAPGTTTITLTVDGLTATYDMVVTDYPAVPIGGSLEINTLSSGRAMFSVTPAETGRYAVWHSLQEAGLVLLDAGIGQGSIYNLQAGVTYYGVITVYPDAEGVVEDTVYAEKVRPVENVTLTGEPGELPVGSRFLLEAKADPVYGVTEGVQWSCSDPDVLLLEHMDPYDGRCEAVVLKEGTATVTVTIGGISASWEYGVPYVPEWQPDPSIPVWSLGTTATMPLAKEESSQNVFCAPEDGYYRFTVRADQETFVTVNEGDVIEQDAVWHNAYVAAGQEVAFDLYLQKDRYYCIQNSGSFEGTGTLIGKVEPLVVSDKPVERIEVTGMPSYEFKDDDYGEVWDGKYIFRPLHAGGLPFLEATVYYTDGTTATLTQDQLVWDVQSDSGLPGCTWNGVPVEFCLLDGSEPTDSLWMTTESELVQARLRYMGVVSTFPVVVEPAHEHEMAFNPHREPTPLAFGEMEHYRCLICEKAYSDEKGEFRIREEELILEYKNEFVVDQSQIQDIVQQTKPGENVSVPLPDGMTDVVLPHQALQEIVNKQGVLELALGDAIVHVDSTALTAILSQGGEVDVTLQVKQVTADMLKEPQKEALASQRVVYVLSAQVLCGSNNIHDFGGGQVTLQVPFTPESGKGYQVIHVADDGTVTATPSAYDDGLLQFSTGHFSEYAIVEDPTAPPMQTPDKETDSLFWLIVVAGVVILIIVVVLFVWKRRKK